MSRDLLCAECFEDFISRMPGRALTGELPSDPGIFYRVECGKAKATPDRLRTITINDEPQVPNPELLCDICNATINVGDSCACRSIYIPLGLPIAAWAHDYIET